MSNNANPDIRLIDDWVECYELFLSLLKGEDPAFLARIGGSDTDFVMEFCDAVKSGGIEGAASRISDKLHRIKEFNGYYDKSNSLDNVQKFCVSLIENYASCKHLLVCGTAMLSELLPNTISEVFRIDTTSRKKQIYRLINLIAARQKPVILCSYTSVEQLVWGRHTLFRAFEEVLPGRRVLVISPFSSSILQNFPNRKTFFKDYNYPEFQLATYNTPVTYDGLSEEYYPDASWFDTLERMKGDIAKLEFDVALLGCGTYAMPLGLFIRDILKRKAVYVGGCLQLYFGIMGRRYEGIHVGKQTNLDAFIYPVERQKYLTQVSVKEGSPKEAFGAYF